MSVPAAQAVRAWVNNPSTGLVGAPPDQPGPLAGGAVLHLRERSPASGAYAVLSLTNTRQLTAEPGGPVAATVTAQIYDGTSEAAEDAATAYADTIRGLRGTTPMGAAMCLATDNVIGPIYIPLPGDTGEAFGHQVTAEFVLVPQ